MKVSMGFLWHFWLGNEFTEGLKNPELDYSEGSIPLPLAVTKNKQTNPHPKYDTRILA